MKIYKTKKKLIIRLDFYDAIRLVQQVFEDAMVSNSHGSASFQAEFQIEEQSKYPAELIVFVDKNWKEIEQELRNNYNNELEKMYDMAEKYYGKDFSKTIEKKKPVRRKK